MRNKIGLLVSVFIFFALGTGWAATAKTNQSEKKIVINNSIDAKIKDFAQRINPPVNARKNALAAKIQIVFPELACKTGVNPAIEVINKAVQTKLLNMLDGKSSESVEQLIQLFVSDYEKSMKTNHEMVGAWFLNFDATVDYSDEDLLCFRILQSVFVGGAHPSSNISYLIFSTKTGKLLLLTDFFSVGNLKKLNMVAEGHFRRICNLKPEESYEKANFWFKDNQFCLNRNFMVSEAGMTFCFNQCEIAPYAKGIIEVKIPWSDLKTILKADGPGQRFLKNL